MKPQNITKSTPTLKRYTPIYDDACSVTFWSNEFRYQNYNIFDLMIKNDLIYAVNFYS